jgi:hypothetical protein
VRDEFFGFLRNLTIAVKSTSLFRAIRVFVNALSTAEPKWLARWQEEGVYKKLRAKRYGAKKFVLHDDPVRQGKSVSKPPHKGSRWIRRMRRDYWVKG